MSEPLVTLAYRSRAEKRAMTGGVLSNILKTAQVHNIEYGVTGALVYGDGQFVQVLEGSPTAVELTMDRIRSDDRHHSLEVVGPLPAHDRSFPDWCMVRLCNEPAVREPLSILFADWTKNGPKAAALLARALDIGLQNDSPEFRPAKLDGGLK